DHVGVVFEIAAEIWSEVFAAAKGRDGCARTRAENADVIRDIGVGADGVDDDGLDNVFAGVTVEVESEFVIGAGPLTEIDRMAGGDVEDEDLEILFSAVAIEFGSGRGLRGDGFGFSGSGVG